MGYTQYWYQKPALDKRKFESFSVVAKEILSTQDAKDILAYESDQTNKPAKVTASSVRFNGKDEDGHETFWLKRVEEGEGHEEGEEGEDLAFNFCKTARKTYDKYVTACLILAKIFFENDIRVSSDGDIEDWEEGRKLVEDALKTKVTLKEFREDNGLVLETNYRPTRTVTLEEFIQDISK